ncbi:MAG: tetratricopeptide repeat protein [Bacteroidales bacterium]|nr:tetratricopeptide repeat protein [Bacteroidales bacterium]
MDRITALILLVTLLLIPFASYSQKTAVFHDPMEDYNTALELYNKEKYGAAREAFAGLKQNLKEQNPVMAANAAYYEAVSAAELFNDDAVILLNNFIENHAQNIHINTARFELANYEYRQDHHRGALKAYNDVNILLLNNKELTEYYFKRGYSYLQSGKNEQAQDDFYQVKTTENKYRAPAAYYHAHLAYLDKDYETAINDFESIRNEKDFKGIVPYYITQIYFEQGKYDRVLAIGPELIEDANNKFSEENLGIMRITGEAYFKTSNYAQAVAYLSNYLNNSREQSDRADQYKLAYAYYQNEEYIQAIDWFQKVTSPKDSLAQNAYYHLGDCYLQTGDKNFASNAFLSAYKIDAVQRIKEDALFNYAKLSIETSYTPYNEAIKAINQYIQEYPNSNRLNEAYSYLVKLFMITSNYKDAFRSIEKIENKNAELRAAYQKITYYRAVELFNDGQYFEAISLFKKSIEYPREKILTAGSYYWMAEAYYRLQQYDIALNYYNKFLVTPGAYSLPYYNTANYDIGYIQFKRENYDQASLAFRKYLRKQSNKSGAMAGDAYIRVGDCNFISNSYDEAIRYYQKAIDNGTQDADYAWYQKAMGFGAKGNLNRKANDLEYMVNTFGKSPYRDDAMFELATTHLVQDNNQQALNYYKKLINDYPNSNYTKKAMLKVGLIYYNNNQNDLALNTLKKVVERFPGTSQAREALASIKSIYVDMGKVDEYAAYAKDTPTAELTVSEQDSLYYITAENYYMNRECNKAVPAFKKYIDKFPNGAFRVNAHFYKAECQYDNQEINQALSSYRFVIHQPQSRFKESALVKAAKIETNRDNCDSAVAYYSKLEQIAEYPKNIIMAIEGQMDCHYQLAHYSKAMRDAQRFLTQDKLTENQEIKAHMTMARSAMELGENDQARESFKKVVRQSHGENAAEAKYKLALLRYRAGEYEPAKQTVFELTDNYSSYDYWVAQGFVLLADVYKELDNTFQAKQTLQSIIDNYEGEDLVRVAKRKLNDIIKQEAMEERMKKEKARDTMNKPISDTLK